MREVEQKGAYHLRPGRANEGAKRTTQEQQEETPEIGKYVEGAVAERDPKGQTARHRGVITGQGENSKEWAVTDPGGDRDEYYGTPIDPKYQTRNVHKDGTSVVPVPSDRAKHVWDLQEMLRKSRGKDSETPNPHQSTLHRRLR